MSLQIQHRAQEFLERPIPKEMQESYVSDSLSNMIIAAYAEDGKLDSESVFLLDICLSEVREVVSTKEGNAQQYFQGCADVLQEIADEEAKQ